MSLTPDEKTKMFTSLAVIETEVKHLRKDHTELKPTVKKNSRFRLMSMGVISFLSGTGLLGLIAWIIKKG